MTQSLTGLQVISFASRLNNETTGLLQKHGARVIAAPALREVPRSEVPEAKAFAEAVCEGAIDALVLLTGVGASLLLKAACHYRPRAELIDGLSKLTLVCRGPKPSSALKPFGLRPTFSVPEPNTWREVLRKLELEWPVSGKRVWIQEYGTRNLELIHALSTRGAEVRSLHVYSWALPEDTAPLKAAILKIVRVQAHVALFTSAVQIEHLLSVAKEIGMAPAVRRTLSQDIVVASVGPITSEALERHGIATDISPGHPKLGHLILAVARRARILVGEKRARYALSSAGSTRFGHGK
ncbi:MAG TPA: uroporphyrinogen-III synthase [Polyangiaceae bacterium]|nr:uroporphyrinogen-III synthase [Polyangiaceae bacterium]